MSFAFLGPDPVTIQLEQILGRLAEGAAPADIETTSVDCKEEPGRRTRDGHITEGQARNEEAAKYLTNELACFANTPGGGAIVLGVADQGELIGTKIDTEWLRHRIYELSQRRLTINARPVEVSGVRLLVVTTPEAIEPIAGTDGRFRWRLADHCVEVDPTTWHAGRPHRSGVDWSAQPSGHTVDDARPAAMEMARRFLGEAATRGDEHAADLKDATDTDLLLRLNVVADENGRLTNAGSLLFVETPDLGIDYIRRDVPGGNSTNRVRSKRPLIEQIYEVDQAIRAANRVIHTAQDGLSHGQDRVIPARAAREAMVNGVTHRDWLSAQPTTIEHIGDDLIVTSPGGFVGTVRPDNIITHPSSPRYKSLAEAIASLRLAEREGIGVDRMIVDMLTRGLREPEITELAGPSVRVALLGGEPDPEMMGLLNGLKPERAAGDLDIVMLINHLSLHHFVDVTTAQLMLQRPPKETETAIDRAQNTTFEGEPLIVPLKGVPEAEPPAYRLSAAARRQLRHRTIRLESPTYRPGVIVAWARHRGRVSSTEAADLADISVVRAGQVLTALEREGQLKLGRKVKAGRGFFYIPT